MDNLVSTETNEQTKRVQMRF